MFALYSIQSILCAKPVFSVSQTMGRDAQQAAKRLWMLVLAQLRGQRGLPPSQVS